MSTDEEIISAAIELRRPKSEEQECYICARRVVLGVRSICAMCHAWLSALRPEQQYG